MDVDRTLVVILNWNGWQDTIACCESLEKCELADTDILVFDNGSNDDSNDHIKHYLSKNVNEEVEVLHAGSECFKLITFKRNHLVFKLFFHPVNLGFAKGCNLSAKYAQAAGYSFLLFLNNDTVVDPRAIYFLTETIVSQKANVIIPQIRYFSVPDIVWNCGGEINYWGKIKYYYAGKLAGSIPARQVFPVGFATGCCLLTKVGFFSQMNGFTEKFFFGEEDVEFSLRLKKYNHSMFCDTRAIVYHKVGSSIKGSAETRARKAYLHLLNRLINMKSFMPRGLWEAWAFVVCLRYYFNLKYDFSRTCQDAIKLFVEAIKLDRVDMKKFREVLENGI